ncbi:nostrin isoform X2 [Polyodon spathula]|uniref:nostrin isoform X2 n=1 Tax=Polyodon spathula TaxID=7913 RepID=UPI001B7DE62A|nr:nostrin isoform X2 [Polyodon spathula]
MKDPVSDCIYNHLYQDLKKFSKNGEHFCKELVAVFQQRADLEISYAKGLQKLASKLTKASSSMAKNCTYNAWSLVSEEMGSTADIHKNLGSAFQQEAIQPIRQVLEEHTKKKKPLDNAVVKTGKLVILNWNEQIKAKKKLFGFTKEHEALFNFVENNKHISTEKEKQKMLNRLTKSSEILAKTDEEYFNINMAGHHTRLKWEATLKNCYQSVQELEKQRIQMLCGILNKYNQHVSTFGQTLITCHGQIDQAVREVDVKKDIQMLVEETSVPSQENKAEFLLADYFEEDSKTAMDKERRKASIKMKLQRLNDNITKTGKDKEGLERMVKTYAENPSFPDQKNLEETEQLLDETTLKMNFLEASYFKLSVVMAELDGKPKPVHRFSDSISKWKDKEYQHSVVQLSSPVKMKKSQHRSKLTSTSSIRSSTSQVAGCYTQSIPTSNSSATSSCIAGAEAIYDKAHNGNLPQFDYDDDDDENSQTNAFILNTGTDDQAIGTCRALYDFQSDREDELIMKTGDLIVIHQKDNSGWWYGSLKGKKGHFPSNYVEQLEQLDINKSSDA